MGIKEDAYRYAVRNAAQHEGKADLKAVIAKVAALHKGIKIGEVIPDIKEVVEKVNSLTPGQLEREYAAFEEEGFELKAPKKKVGLPDLDWAQSKEVVTRYAPNPNGPFHLGNARAAILSHEFAQKYEGKFILRFEDTDPKVKKPIENAEEIFKEDLSWLGIGIDETYFASERLEIYYKYMRKVIEKGHAYVCTCDSSEWKDMKKEGKACKCRKQNAGKGLELFEKMLSNELKEGEAVLRVKTDLKHKDPSIRDWWAAKIVDNPSHVRAGNKYHVWPSYNFQSAIDDHEMGVTLIVRGQEHAQNVNKQKYLYEYFGWEYPSAYHFGRISLEGMVLSTSKIKEGVESGKYIGWDDPRLGTIMALRRRGYDSRALKDAIMEIGVKSSDTTIEINWLNDLNKKYIDNESERVVFFEDPVELEVLQCPETVVVRGGREYKLGRGTQKFIVDRKDVGEYKERGVFRLRDAYNVIVTGVAEGKLFSEFVGETRGKAKVVPWAVKGIKVEVMMGDAGKVEALAGATIAHKKVGEHIYLERFGYCRIDGVEEGKVGLWFSHK